MREPPSTQVEVPSVEHPHLLSALIDEAQRRGVKVDRVSHGGGLRLLTEGELRAFLDLAHENAMDVFLYMSSRGSLDGAMHSDLGDQIVSEKRFATALADVERCAELGVDGVIVADIGLLAVAGRRRLAGEFGELQLKTAIAMAPANAAGAALFEELGATSINVGSRHSIHDLIPMRGTLGRQTTLDIYIESPASHGGLRYDDAFELAASLRPIVFKIGLQGAPRLNPYGAHLEPMAERSMREKIRRVEFLDAALAAESTTTATARSS